MNINRRLNGLTLTTVFVLAIAGCDAPVEVDPADKTPAALTLQTETVAVVRTRIPRIYKASGTVVAPQSFVVTSTINGFIKDIAVKEGDKVEADALLVDRSCQSESGHRTGPGGGQVCRC